MQQTVFFKSDKKVVHVVPTEHDRYTRCGIIVKRDKSEVWNEEGLSCPICLAKVEEEISNSFDFMNRVHPEVFS
jgi:hypothetical protein